MWGCGFRGGDTGLGFRRRVGVSGFRVVVISLLFDGETRCASRFRVEGLGASCRTSGRVFMIDTFEGISDRFATKVATHFGSHVPK